MTGTGVLTAVERRGSRPAVGWAVILVLLMWSGVQAAEVLNPSFETTYMGTPYPRTLPQSWYHADHASFNSYSTNSWSTDGTLSAALLTRVNKPVSPGEFQNFYQFVDLTGIGAIQFDVRLVAPASGAFEHFEASFLVDGVALWTQNAAGVYLNQQVSTSGMTDWHSIEMRIAAVDAGTFTLPYSTQWDNVRLIEAPKTVPAEIALDPNALHLHALAPMSAGHTNLPTAKLYAGGTSGLAMPHSPGKWVVCYIELPAGYDVNEIDEATVRLQDIPAYLGKQGLGKLACHKDRVNDRDGDGIPERIFRFDLDAVRAIVQPPEAILTVKGSLTDERAFEGSATIKVVDKLAERKARLEELKAKVQDLRDKHKDAMNQCKDKDGKGGKRR